MFNLVHEAAQEGCAVVRLVKTNKEIAAMGCDAWRRFEAMMIELCGPARQSIPVGRSCGYCDRFGLHEDLCRNPWDLR